MCILTQIGNAEKKKIHQIHKNIPKWRVASSQQVLNIPIEHQDCSFVLYMKLTQQYYMKYVFFLNSYFQLYLQIF